MKKLILIFFATAGVFQIRAQNINPEVDRVGHTPQSKSSKWNPFESRWCIDVNALGGMVTQEVTSTKSYNYLNEITTKRKVSKPEFNDGISYGFDAQLGFFFGKKHHFGLGSGVLFMWQQGNMTTDNYHVEYQSTDKFGSTFRQLITSNGPIKETINTSNFNIPLVLKYKTKFSKNVGFTMDAGVVYNVKIENKYTSDAGFDYEAIYKYSDGGTPVYDNATVPGSSDLLITKSQYLTNHTSAQLQEYFTKLRSEGYNVGLGVKPTGSNSGEMSYSKGSYGVLVKPAISFYLSDRVAINLGGYYMYQEFEHGTPASYQLTGKMGQYNPVLNSVSYVASNSYGVNLGLRYMFQRNKDTDGDGISDKDDKCPNDPGLKKFQGCPDTDGDGIQDADDPCATVAGLEKFRGCPDSDGDGIPDNEDECPEKRGLDEFDGCPDTDGDGIPDNEDRCPTVAGSVENHGCPATTTTTHEEINNVVDVSTPILFDNNKMAVKEESKPVITQAVKKLNQNKKAYIEVNGYTDSRGSKAYNKSLSQKRAVAVKKELQKEGASPKVIKTIAHGEESPAGNNNTDAGRAQNRRVVMKVKEFKAGRSAKKNRTAAGTKSIKKTTVKKTIFKASPAKKTTVKTTAGVKPIVIQPKDKAVKQTAPVKADQKVAPAKPADKKPAGTKPASKN